MKNVCKNDVRFAWQPHNDLNFSPKVGHLRLGRTKVIKATFFADKPTRHNGIRVNCQWSKIQLDDPSAPEWDDSQKVLRFVPRTSVAPEPPKVPEKPVKKPQPKKVPGPGRPGPPTPPGPVVAEETIVRVTEIKPEPAYQVLPGKFKDLQVKVNAISDHIRYTQDVTEIEFAPTMMFQSRMAEAKVTNISQIRFEYRWILEKLDCLRTDYAREHVLPFSVLPTSGYIEAGQSTTFQVSFAPEEVDDFKAVLLCDIPFLSQMQPLRIQVTGFSRRPLCHFNAVFCDYISGGRRHPDYTYPLSDDVKVVEIFAKGVGARTLKKFDIINPTSAAYEIIWTLINDSANGQVNCEIPNAIVSSGRRHVATFSYLPTSVKTVEALFEFHIPEHNVRVPLLVVGRIMPASVSLPTLPPRKP
jgi:hydrocephalus-inducing protein